MSNVTIGELIALAVGLFALIGGIRAMRSPLMDDQVAGGIGLSTGLIILVVLIVVVAKAGVS